MGDLVAQAEVGSVHETGFDGEATHKVTFLGDVATTLLEKLTFSIHVCNRIEDYVNLNMTS